MEDGHRIRVKIMEPSGDALIAEVELPDDVEIGGLLRALLTRLGIPTVGPGGQIISYRLYLGSGSGRQLLDNETLSSVGVQPDEALILSAEPIAGGKEGHFGSLLQEGGK